MRTTRDDPRPDQPAADAPEAGRAWVHETVDANLLVVDVALPDVDPTDDLQVTIGGGCLHVYAERRVGPPAHGQARHAPWRSAGSFAASVPLPAGVVEAGVDAVYRAGTLEVRIPFDPAASATATIPVRTA